jgi:hypothetical protein
MPVPEHETDCVDGVASSVTTICPRLAPVEDGVKITSNVQLPFGATWVPLQVSLATV